MLRAVIFTLCTHLCICTLVIAIPKPDAHLSLRSFQVSKDYTSQNQPVRTGEYDTSQNRTARSGKFDEAAAANATCNAAASPDKCQSQELPGKWKCEWQDGVCVAVNGCAWRVKDMFVSGELGVVWVMSIMASAECVVRLFHGCDIGMGIHCVLAFLLCTCCCCFCRPCVRCYEDGDCECCVQRSRALRMQLQPLPRQAPRQQPAPPNQRQDENPPASNGDVASNRDADLVVCNMESTDDWHELGAFQCGSKMASCRITCHWQDQGSGEQKGRIRWLLLRETQVLVTEDVFGVCGRTRNMIGALIYSHDEKLFTSTRSNIVARAQQGDTIRFEYQVGSGGGHQLRIKFFGVDPEYNRS